MGVCVCVCVCVCVLVTQSCPTPCDPMHCSPPGSSVHGILQARILEWVAISFSNVNFSSSSLATKSCPTLVTPMNCSLPGSFVHGNFQTRILEWVAISFSQGIFPTQGSNLHLLHCRQILYQLSHQGSPIKN